MKNVLVLTTALTFAAMPAIASAQPSTSSTTAPQADDQNAQSLADRAYDAYQKGDFPKAVAFYMDSYKLNPSAEILYNVASIYDKKLNDPRLALEYYRRHNAAPDAKGDLVGKATARIAALQAQLDNPNGARIESDTETNRDAGDSGGTMRTVGVIVGAVGLVGVGVGVVTGLIASGKHSDAKDAGCSNDLCPNEDARSKEKSAANVANISTVGFIAGGVLLAGGVVMYLLAPKKHANTTRGDRDVHFVPQADAHGGGLSVLGRF